MRRTNVKSPTASRLLSKGESKYFWDTWILIVRNSFRALLGFDSKQRKRKYLCLFSLSCQDRWTEQQLSAYIALLSLELDAALVSITLETRTVKILWSPPLRHGALLSSVTFVFTKNSHRFLCFIFYSVGGLTPRWHFVFLGICKCGRSTEELYICKTKHHWPGTRWGHGKSLKMLKTAWKYF